MGIQRSFLLLARQVFRIASEYDRLWSSHIKLQKNGGSDVTAMTFLSTMIDTTYGPLRVTA
jgi:hypothetical protein